METLALEELLAELKTECGKRQWPPPDSLRLKKLRLAKQLPPAQRIDGEWRYPAESVAAYIRTEEARHASGSRVRSWKAVEERERLGEIEFWFQNPETPVPRATIERTVQELPTILNREVPGLMFFIERPVRGAENDQLDDAARNE